MPVPSLKARATSAARVEPHFGGDSSNAQGCRLFIPAGRANRFRLAQLDDYSSLPRRKLPWHPPLTLGLRARVSEPDLPGTWGFGLWNDPFGLSLGFGGTAGRLPALPNAAWFFHASQGNYLSFRDDKPGNGFLAQCFCSQSFHPSLIPSGLVLPFSPKTTRRLLNRAIEEDGVRISVDVTQWHEYRLEWGPHGVTWWVDDALILESPIAPRPPLGLVIWMDNQFAAFRPDGKLRWGLQENPSAWMEIEELSVN
jgi:hypothetical protein